LITSKKLIQNGLAYRWETKIVGVVGVIDVGLLTKSSNLAAALGLTKFITIIVVNLVTVVLLESKCKLFKDIILVTLYCAT
jgi:hypothetical protein